MNPEITVPVPELKTALAGLSKVVSRKSTLPVLETVKVSRDKQGKVSLQATDLDSFVTYHTEGMQKGQPIEVLVALEPLSKTVKSASATGDLSFIPESKDRVKLRYAIGPSPVVQSIKSLPVEEWPPTPPIRQQPIIVDKEFGPTLRQALGCASEDSSRHVLQGAYVDVSDPKCHYLVGTNGRILYSANSFCFDLKQSLIIPNQKFLGWNGFLDDGECRMTVEPGKDKTGGWVQLQTARWTCIAKQIEGEYPKWRQVVPRTTEGWTRVTLSKEALDQMLSLAPKLPGDVDPNYAIRLRVTAGYLNLEGRNLDDKEWTSVPIQGVTITGKPVTIGLNRHYLLQALRYGLNELAIENPLSPILCSGTGKKLVIMPLKLDDGMAPKPVTVPTAPKPTASNAATSPITKTTTNERNNMPRTRTVTPMAPVNGESHETNNTAGSMVEHLEQIKDTLKGVLRELNEVGDQIKQVEKEKRTTARDLDSIRNKLRGLQNVTI